MQHCWRLYYNYFSSTIFIRNIQSKDSNKKTEASSLPTWFQLKITCYMFDQSFLHPFKGKYRRANAPLQAILYSFLFNHLNALKNG